MKIYNGKEDKSYKTKPAKSYEILKRENIYFLTTFFQLFEKVRDSQLMKSEHNQIKEPIKYLSKKQ